MGDCAFVNRELSWLDFNKRVLSLAEDEQLPLGERLSFLAIGANNFSEFFRVRVGGLKLLIDEEVNAKDCSGLTPQKQFDAVIKESTALFQKMDTLYCELASDILPKNGVKLLKWDALGEDEKLQWGQFAESDILPLLSPVAMKEEAVNATLLKAGVLSLMIHIVVKGKDELAIVTVPQCVERFIRLHSVDGVERFLPVEELLCAKLDALFQGCEVKDAVSFVLYRNAGMTVDETISTAFLPQMEGILLERERSFPIRIDVSDTVSEELLALFKQRLSVDDTLLFARSGIIDMVGLFSLSGALGADFHFQHQEPLMPPVFEETESLFELIREKDQLLFHPYDSYYPVIRLIKEAADDPAVLSIKQTLYRTSAQSEIIKALKRAAANGKNVTVLCEVKARFDEEQNMLWARELEDAGVQVVYGVKNLKTHAKALLIIRKGVKGIERFMHYSTGNYNEKTAELYTDFSLFTCNRSLGADLSQVFNMITGYALPEKMKKLSVSPLSLKNKLLRLIQKEQAVAKGGGLAHIRAKMNALVDTDIIEALYSASQAGVRIELNIRGICMLKPGVPGLSDGIRVISVLGRNLEHARVFSFYNDGKEKVFISSADWMPRNLERRIELMVPIVDKEVKETVLSYLDMLFSQTTFRWEFNGDSEEWVAFQGEDIQMSLYRSKLDEYHEIRSLKPLLFETHTKQGV